MGIKIDASAFYPSLEPFYNQGDIPFLRVADVDSHIDYDNCIKIPREVVENERFRTLKVISKGDIVITKGGSIARVGLIEKETAVTRDLIFINSSIMSDLDYKFLYLYLMTSISYDLLIRSSSMTAQPHLTIKLVKNLPLFNPSKIFKEIIVSIYDLSNKKRQESKMLYSQAEILILEELGFKDFIPTSENISKPKLLSEVIKSNLRFDSEYYLPVYAEILEKIYTYKNSWKKLKDVCILLDNNYMPKKDISYKYIELSNIGSTGNIRSETIEIGKKLPSRARRLVQTNNVIISSIEGSIDKIALVRDKYNGSICSTGFYVLSSTMINPETLLVLFKNEIYQNILIQNCSGTILTAINKEDFIKIPIPLIDEKVQEKISKKIKSSFTLKEESERLFKLAIKAIEVSINTSETTAENFIKENINA